LILQGSSIAPGLAVGRARVMDPKAVLVSALEVETALSPDQELERFHAALGRSVPQLRRVERDLVQRGHAQDAEIFSAHAAMLEDPVLVEQIQQRILGQGLSAEAAIAQVAMADHQRFAASDFSMIQDKAADVLDIGRRLIQCLRSSDEVAEASGLVIVAPVLTPSELVHLAHRGAAAVVVESCGTKSHTAILARGLSLPLVAGIASATQLIREGVQILVDAGEGLVIVDPADDEVEPARSIRDRLAAVAAPAAAAPGPAVTRDGVRVTMLLNISDPLEAEGLAELGVDGVGLFRTEFVYMDREGWPSEEESYQIYRRVADAVGEGELSLRLADFGAEKSPPYANIPINRNPSLGVRGVRLLLQREDILRPQVQAIARLARERPVNMLLPMIDSVDTLDAVISRLCQICRCRSQSELPFRLSAMIETPSAALMIEEILTRVDGVSLGLNDLTQYLLAADRDDELVEDYHDALQPPVLRLAAQVSRVAERLARPLTVCGELAGDPMLAAALLALGIRRFSVSRTDLARSVALLLELDLGALTARAPELLQMESSAAVRRWLAQQAPAAEGAGSRGGSPAGARALIY
jgi:phosphotransferase system enzyme I (PtsI)